MKYKLSLRLLSLILTLTLFVGIVTPTIASAEEIENSRKVKAEATSDALLNVLKSAFEEPEEPEEHINQLEITDVEFEMDRDFDQTGYVTVKNTGANDVEVILDIANDYDDIFLGFVGAGSPDQPTLITAGSSVQVKLTVFAQKVGKNSYTLPVKSYIVEGSNYILDTETNVVINFKEAELNFACDLISTNTDTLEQNFMLVNQGDDLSCVSITADNNIADYVMLNPTVSDIPVKNGETLNIKVTPNYTALKNNNVSLVKGNIVVSAAGNQQTFAVTIDTEGKEIHSITMGELVAYQKGYKEYYDLTADVLDIIDSTKIIDNSTDDNINCTMEYSIPLVDKNTDEEVGRMEESFSMKSYSGKALKSGDILEEQLYLDGNSLVFECTMIVNADELKEFAGTLDEDYYGIMNEFTGELGEHLDKFMENNSWMFTKTMSKDGSSENENSIGDFVGNYWDTAVGTTSDAVELKYKNSKILSKAGIVGTAIDTVQLGIGGYKWYTGENHTKENMVLNSPHLTPAEKQRYQELCKYKDMLGVGAPAAGLAVTAALTAAGTIVPGLGNGLGFAIGVLASVGISYLANEFEEDWDKEMAELERKAGIGEGAGGEGGQNTDKNKRNQCTNAGLIEGDYNSPYDYPWPSDDYPEEDPTAPTTPTDPDNPDDPDDPDDPTDPDEPIEPEQPTSPTSSEGNPSLGVNNKITIKTDKDSKLGIASARTFENIKVWLQQSNKPLTTSNKFEYKLQYKPEDCPLWFDYGDYTSTPKWDIAFNRVCDYELRCLIRAKAEKSVSYTPTKEISIVEKVAGITFGAGGGYGRGKVVISSRLAAGDEAANDDNMFTAYYMNGQHVGAVTNNGHAQLSMIAIQPTKKNMKTGTNTITAHYSTTPTHYRTVSDMQIVTLYPNDTIVNYIGDLDNHPDVTIHPDFTVFEENIYTDSEFYVNEETTLHCKVYNRNAAGGWVDIVVKDGEEVIYTETNTWMGMFSEKTLDIPWTPKTRDNAITVELTNKCVSLEEADLTNNKALRNMVANEYIEPSFGETDNSVALEDREFSVYTHVLDSQNVTNVACYVDDVEQKLSSSVIQYKKNTKYWATIKGLSEGNHKLKYVITYEKAGKAIGTLEKIIDINVISKESSSTVIAKNTSANNTSAVVYRNGIIFSEHTPNVDGTITVMYNSDMYNNRSAYKLAVYTDKGVYVTSLVAGTISVDNTKVQNTFKVGISTNNIRIANLYIKNSTSNYYQQIPYNSLYGKGETLLYLSDDDYALYNKCNDAYMVLVTSSNVVYKLQLITNSKRVETFDEVIELNNNNLYNPVKSASNIKLLSGASKDMAGITYNLFTEWSNVYSDNATMSIQKSGETLFDEAIDVSSAPRLSAGTYDVYYTLKSENYMFDMYKEINITNRSIVNRISDSFAGELVASTNEVNEGENIDLSISNLLDENGNQLTGIRSMKDEFIVTVTFTDVDDSTNVCTREISTNNLQDTLTNVKAPEKFGNYKISLNVAVDTYNDITLGDVNNDGEISVVDVIRMLRFIIGMDTFTDSQAKAADVDMSNSVTIIDVLRIQKIIIRE